VNNEWAVVLGVSAGSGMAIARAVARDPGLHVFGAHRGNHPEQAETLARDVADAGRRAVFRVGDAGTVEGAMTGVEALLREAGPRSVKFFVHSIANASLGTFTSTRSGRGEWLAPRQIEKTFDSMAHSFVYWIQSLLDRDLLAPGARLLALTNPLQESIVSHCGLVAATKAALEMYVRYLALELGPLGHRVNMLKFGTVITPAVATVYGADELARIEAVHRKMIPAGRMCTPDEVGRFVSLILDERAEWLNGATIDFTGAMTQSLLDVMLVRR
jgi:NAD(P)-dependent dehydrogenase (short-subunit alcohol dehydrogenase family)